VPPAAGVTLQQVRMGLTKDVFERKLSRELGVMFGELKQAANPNILLRDTTSSKEFDDRSMQSIEQVGSAPK